MLVVVAGATGHIGQKLIDSLHARGHQVRALARNRSKLDKSRLAKVHEFIESKTYYDTDALDRACKGADAVVSVYGHTPELQVDGHLALLRAAERANIRRFVVSTWNNDWSRDPLGLHEPFDGYLAFRRIAELSSTIKPIYIFTGVLADVFWTAIPEFSYFDRKHNGVWDRETETFGIWGTGDEPWPWTTVRDAAEFTAAIVGSEDAEKGGFWNTVSGINSLKEFATAYEKVTNRKVKIDSLGTANDLRKTAFAAREQSIPLHYHEYSAYFYQLYTVDGTWEMKKIDNNKLDVEVTRLEDFLKDNFASK